MLRIKKRNDLWMRKWKVHKRKAIDEKLVAVSFPQWEPILTMWDIYGPAGADKTVCEVLGKEKESPTQKNCQARANKYFSKPVYGKVILNSIRKEFHGRK